MMEMELSQYIQKVMKMPKSKDQQKLKEAVEKDLKQPKKKRGEINVKTNASFEHRK